MQKEEAKENLEKFSLLSDKAILRHIKEGSVVIHPFDQRNLSTSSFDVTLGPFYYREQPPEPGSFKSCNHFKELESTTHPPSPTSTKFGVNT
jgi:hypothetical protein